MNLFPPVWRWIKVFSDPSENWIFLIFFPSTSDFAEWQMNNWSILSEWFENWKEESQSLPLPLSSDWNVLFLSYSSKIRSYDVKAVWDAIGIAFRKRWRTAAYRRFLFTWSSSEKIDKEILFSNFDWFDNLSSLLMKLQKMRLESCQDGPFVNKSLSNHMKNSTENKLCQFS